MPFDESAYQRVTCTSDTPIIRMSQGEQRDFSVTIRDENGDAVNLSDYTEETESSSSSMTTGYSHRLQVKMAVSQSMTSSSNEFETTGTILDEENGIVQFSFTPVETAKAGIFTASVGVFAADILRYQVMYYLEFMPTNFLSSGVTAITVPEVRMELMDTCPDANYLIDELEFTDADIIHAMRKAVDTFNDALPPVGGYTYDSFPFRSLWFKGTVAYLLKSISHKYRRNALRYQAGGLTIADQEKHREYLEVAKAEEEEYMLMVERRKVAINISTGYGSIGPSPYGGRLYR